jgi:hypothetical protein
LRRIWKVRWARRLIKTAIGFAVFMVVGNLAVLGLSQWASRTVQSTSITSEGISNFEEVDDRLWRGAAPTDDGYRWLASEGVTTVVDLRPEDEPNQVLLAELGIDFIRIPIRDGQTPSQSQTTKFLESVQESPGITFVNCGAGVGRTGAMAATYLVETGQENPRDAIWRNLSVGPPSLEQLAYADRLDGEGTPIPDAAIVAASRTLDAPRRMLSRWGP